MGRSAIIAAPVMNYLASSGEYNLDDPADQNRLTQDTNQFARTFSALTAQISGS